MEEWSDPWKKRLRRNGFQGPAVPDWGPIRARKQRGERVVLAEAGAETDQNHFIFRLKTIFANPDRFRFSVHPSTAGSEFLTSLGLVRDHETGRRQFDDRFLVRTNDADRFARLFDRTEIHQMQGIATYQDLRIVAERGGGSGPRLPDGLEELMFQIRPRDNIDTSEVGRVVHIFESVLAELDAVLFDQRTEVQRMAARLRATPEGRIQEDYLLWDGDPPRMRLVEQMGKLGDPGALSALVELLDNRNRGLALAALTAIRKIDSAEAVPGVIPQLGRYATGGDWAYHDVVVKFLRAHDAGDVAHAFDRAVFHGDEDLAPLRRFPEPVCGALVKVLVEGLTFSAAHAARALGELGDRRAIPIVKRTLRQMAGLSDEERKMFEDALVALRRRDALPRPAQSPDSDAALPRPADAASTHEERLPQPADEPEVDG